METQANNSQAQRANIRRALAQRLGKAETANGSQLAVQSRREPLPASSAQTRLWFLERLQPGNAAYSVITKLNLTGPLDRETLVAAYSDVVDRHEAMRTRLVYERETLYQRIASPEEADRGVHFEDVRSAGEPEVAVRALVESWIAEPFDLTRDLPARAYLVRYAEHHHVFLLVMHHTATDGWSRGVFVRELANLYQARVAGVSPLLPKLEVQYADYAAWQTQLLSETKLDSLIDYWQQQLDGAPERIHLPTDWPRPLTREGTGGREQFCIRGELLSQCQALAKEHDVTLYMLLLAVFSVLMQRLTGDNDVVIGSPVAGRLRSEFESLIGFFANTLAIRTRPEPGISGVALLKSVRKTTLEAFERQETPFEKLVEALNPPRSTSHTPIFQVAFNLMPESETEFDFGNLTAELEPMASEAAKFDLTLNVGQTEHGLALDAEYDSALFRPSTVQRWLQHYACLIESFVEAPERDIAELNMMPAADAALMDRMLNDASTPYPQDAIHRLFERQAAISPHAVALTDGEQPLTYELLNQRANAWAFALRQTVGRDSRIVGLCLDRSIDAVTAMLATLKAGLAYLPLSPDYPSRRVRTILQRAGVHSVVTNDQHRELVDGCEVQTITTDSLACDHVENLEFDGSRESLAYVMFTSGSTGEPKGVAIPHRGVTRLVQNTNYVPLDARTTTLQMASLAFDATTFEIWGPLLNGGRVVIYDESHATVGGIGRAVEQHGVNTMFVTTALFNTIVDTQADVLKPLRHLLVGGEACSPLHMEKACEVLPDTRLVNIYGPTESTTFATFYPLPRPFQATAHSIVPIGRPLANTSAHVLDNHRNLVPPGVVGELYLGGDGLAEGYCNDPERTDERFVECTIHNQRKRLYATGDLARLNSDGYIEHLGRVDRQVKVRGFRIELPEVEQQIAKHAEVSRAAATVIDEGSSANLAVLLVADPAAVDRVRADLAEELPPYMLPSLWACADTLPVNANGKVDEAALRALIVEQRTAECHVPETLNTREADLTTIWQQLLGVQSVGVNDSFFDLGGNSLLAVELMDRIERHYNQSLPLAKIIEYPTVKHIAGLLDRGYDPSTWTPLVPLTSNLEGNPLFMVHAVGGNVHGFVSFARRIQSSRPVYGLQARGFFGGQQPYKDLRQMAASYIDAIRSVQPSGPYYLGGLSMGGQVAFEMAQQLRAAGEEVAYLVIGDTWFRRGPHINPLRKVFADLTKLVVSPSTVRRLLKSRARRVATSSSSSSSSGFVSAQHQLLHETHLEAIAGYEPLPYDGHVTLVRATDMTRQHIYQERASDGKTMGWGKLAQGGVTLRWLEGAHGSIFYSNDGADFAQVLLETMPSDEAESE